MGVYAVSRYGFGVYGGLTAEQFSTESTILPVGYDRLLLTWTVPGGSWSQLMLLRSSYGHPMTITEGTRLLEADLADGGIPTSFLDGDEASPGPLAQGRTYYYTLFVFATEDGRWIPVSFFTGLVPRDYGYGDTFWNLTPHVYRAGDDLQHLVDGKGPLRRFYGLLGYQVDRLRTEVDTLLDISAVDRVPGVLLPSMADTLGVAYEPELGMRVSRSLVKNAVYTAKTRGTRPGIEAAASSFTEFDARAVVGKNLLLDKNASSFLEPTVSTWEAVQHCAIAPRLPTEYEGAIAGTGSLRMTGTGTGDSMATSGTFGGQTLVPIKAGQQYTASAYVRAASTVRTSSVSIAWYSAAGSILSTVESTLSSNTTAWVRRTVTATAPVDAAWASVVFTVLATGNGEVHHWSNAQIEQGNAVTGWESGRKVHVYLKPRRSNLVRNPSFEVNSTGWGAVGGNTTVARSTALAHSGAASLSMTATAAGSSVAQIVASHQIPVSPGETYTMSGFMRPGAGAPARSASVAFFWYDAASTQIQADWDPNGPQFEVADGWQRVSGTMAAPAGAAFCRIRFRANGVSAGEVHHIDSILFEESEFLQDYFDASLFPPSDYYWAGAAHDSVSHLYSRRLLKDERLQTVLRDYVPSGAEFQTHYGEAVPASSV